MGWSDWFGENFLVRFLFGPIQVGLCILIGLWVWAIAQPLGEKAKKNEPVQKAKKNETASCQKAKKNEPIQKAKKNETTSCQKAKKNETIQKTKKNETASCQKAKTKPANAVAKKDKGKVIAIYEIGIYCKGCAKTIKRKISRYEGVEDVTVDQEANVVTVIGKMDPAKVRDNLAAETKKRIVLFSDEPKKDAAPAATGVSGDEKPPKESKVVLKIRQNSGSCITCIHNIREVILKIPGVQSADVDEEYHLVTVKGTMDINDHVPYLNEKLQRGVEVVPPKKEHARKKKHGGADNKEKGKEAAAGDEKKEGVRRTVK